MDVIQEEMQAADDAERQILLLGWTRETLRRHPVKRSRKPPKKRVIAGREFREWCKSFQDHNASRAGIVLYNILYDCTNRRLRSDVLSAFLLAFRRIAASQPADSVIRKIVEDDPDRLLCQGTDIPNAEPCSRIMDGRDFLERNIRLRRLGLKIPARDVGGTIKELQRGGLRGITKKDMRGRLPFAWVTKTSAIDEIRAKTPVSRLADELRDQLGLHHLREDQYLVEVVYPPGTPVALRAPTFLEGNDIVFRSKRGRDSWGRAVDLRTLEDGLPEAVHLPTPFTDQYGVRDVGRLRRCTGLQFEKLARWGGCAACTGRRCACRIQARLSR